MKKVNKHMKQVGNIKDRGSIKWQGMFLTEHVALLRELKEENNKLPRPNLDEYDMQLIHEEIDLAMKRQCYVLIHTWKEGVVTEHHGKVVDVNILTRVLHYEDPFKSHQLDLDEIVSISMVD